MKLIPLLLVLWAPALLALEPQPPRSIRLDENGISEILIHHGLTTVLLFPEPVAMVIGEGLTDGSIPGVVQYSNPRGSGTLVLRDLESLGMIIMQVMVDDEIFVFRLSHSERPDTLVRLRSNEQRILGKEVSVEEVSKQRIEVSDERLEQLGKLARSRDVLERSLPQYYRDVTSRGVSWVHKEKGLTFEITEVHRFADEDALVLLGTIRNSNRVREWMNREALRIRVGESRVYKPTKVGMSSDLIPGGGGSSNFELILVGDSKGRRVHLSPDNHFHLELAK